MPRVYHFPYEFSKSRIADLKTILTLTYTRVRKNTLCIHIIYQTVKKKQNRHTKTSNVKYK